MSAIGELALAVKLYPQSMYCGLNKSLHQEWQFIQRVCGGISSSFTGVEEALVMEFLPALFEESVEPNLLDCCSTHQASGLGTAGCKGDCRLTPCS
jgi:hypothetical protein